MTNMSIISRRNRNVVEFRDLIYLKLLHAKRIGLLGGEVMRETENRQSLMNEFFRKPWLRKQTTKLHSTSRTDIGRLQSAGVVRDRGLRETITTYATPAVVINLRLMRNVKVSI